MRATGKKGNLMERVHINLLMALPMRETLRMDLKVGRGNLLLKMAQSIQGNS